ncbi:Cytochrome c7 c [uncultured archaeon]|nr:Cytochrome c7 c [uncultured archaeon]
MFEYGIFSQKKDCIGIVLFLAVFGFFIPIVLAESPNDACFSGVCHNSSGPTIDRTLYDSNPHKIIKCIECHVNSTTPRPDDPEHGNFIRQLNGSKITGPLKTQYYSQNFSLCYYCHAEKSVVGLLPDMIPSANHVNLTPIVVSSIGTNFININGSGYHNGSEGGGADIPTNIHWNHLDAFGSLNYGSGGKFDFNMSGKTTSYQSCPACHNVHGTNYPKMTKNDLAITYSSDDNGTFGYIGSDAYLYSGGDLYCGACHTSGTSFKYYRTEIKIFQDCISCHVDGSPGNVNRTAFSQGAHVNINKTEGIGLVNNSDCWTCHFNMDMNRSNIRQCNYCHTGTVKPEVPTAPIIRTHVSGVKITNYSCADCHSKVIVDPGTGIPNVTSHYLKRPTVLSEKYCDYCHGPNPSSPFNATNKTIPAFSHDDPSWNGNSTCRTCHTNSSVSADPLANDTSSFHDLTTELGDAYNGTTKADCFICHVQKSPQFVAAPSPTHDITGYTVEDCRNCHTSGTGTEPQKLHSVSASATGGCIPCHSNNATRYYANTSLFGRHANVNTTDGLNNVTDADCKTCHFGSADGSMKMKLGAANYSNTYFCDDCHVSGGRNPDEYVNISSAFRKSIMPPGHGLADCKWCHLAGASLTRPLSPELRYHPNGPRGTAAGKNCVICHVNSNLPDSPFHAPGESHSSQIDGEGGCASCHGSADNHLVGKLNSQSPPTISDFSIPSSVISGNPAEIQATITDITYLLQIAAAQYQVSNISGIVIDWTPMTPKDGAFNYASEVVNATLDTTGFSGIYTVKVKGMASGPKTDSSKPYYPLNGDWSGISSMQLTVNQPTGYANGTVSGSLGNIIGATVITNTSVSTITDQNGKYSLNLTNGTYRLTASKEPEYYPNSSVIVTVTAYTTVTQDIILATKPTGNITGTVNNK